MDIFSKYALFVPLNNENLIDYECISKSFR